MLRSLEEVQMFLLASPEDNMELTKGDINTAYHTGATAMGATGFGPLTAPQIISRMKLNYGNPVIG